MSWHQVIKRDVSMKTPLRRKGLVNGEARTPDLTSKDKP